MKKTFQDVLSSVKTALTSDTGKAIGAGLAGVTAGALLGGEGGVQAVGALGSAVQGVRNRKKQEAIEEENRDLRKLQKTKAELDLEASRENITGKRLDNMKKVFGDAVSGSFMPFGSKKTTVAADKFGKMGEHDVALEDKVKSIKQPDFKPTVVARTGPTSAMVNDEEQLVKNVENIQGSAAKDAAGLAQKLGVVGLGREYLLKNRRDLAEQVKAYSFEPEYEKAFWRELQEQIAPGSIARAKEMLGAEADLSVTEQYAMAQPDLAGTSIGATAGGAFGSMAGPVGIMAGTVIGGLVGGYVGRGVYSAMESQKDVAPTPAVAGADKTAADMASYSISPEATALINNLSRNAQPGDFDAISQQLPMLPDFKALPVGDQERVLIELERRIPRRPLPRIGPYYRTPQEQAAAQQPVNSLRDTINDMGQWATRKLGIGG
ncbi:MAG TPA: hypothetical protein PLR50_05480 [Candidatus Rifleibacterium sp.]|nr:hypothetical protein [Candidatus Rifleibacterium sp.]